MNIVNEQKDFLLKEGIFENEFVLLDNHNSTIIFKNEKKEIKLTELQRRFMLSLLKGENRKNDIIRTVWFYNHETITDNNYHQLVFQCRALLAKHDIPGEIIKTIPRFGVMLSFQDYALESAVNIVDIIDDQDIKVEKNKEETVFFSFAAKKYSLMLMTVFSCAAFLVMSV